MNNRSNTFQTNKSPHNSINYNKNIINYCPLISIVPFNDLDRFIRFSKFNNFYPTPNGTDTLPVFINVPGCKPITVNIFTSLPLLFSLAGFPFTKMLANQSAYLVFNKITLSLRTCPETYLFKKYSNIHFYYKLYGGMEKHMRRSASSDYYDYKFRNNSKFSLFKNNLDILSKQTSSAIKPTVSYFNKSIDNYSYAPVSSFHNDNNEIFDKIYIWAKNEQNEIIKTFNNKLEYLDNKIEIIKSSLSRNSISTPQIHASYSYSYPTNNIDSVEKIIDNKIFIAFKEFREYNAYQNKPIIIAESHKELLEQCNQIFLTKQKFLYELNLINAKLSKFEETLKIYRADQNIKKNHEENNTDLHAAIYPTSKLQSILTSPFPPKNLKPESNCISGFLLKLQILQQNINNLEIVILKKVKVYVERVERSYFDLFSKITNVDRNISNILSQIKPITQISNELSPKKDMILDNVRTYMKKSEEEAIFRETLIGCTIGTLTRKTENNFNILFTDLNELKNKLVQHYNKSETNELFETEQKEIRNLKETLKSSLESKADNAKIEFFTDKINNIQKSIDELALKFKEEISWRENIENNIKGIMKLFSEFMSVNTLNYSKIKEKYDTKVILLKSEIKNELNLIHHKINDCHKNAFNFNNDDINDIKIQTDITISKSVDNIKKSLTASLSSYVTNELLEKKITEIKNNIINSKVYKNLLLFYFMRFGNTFSEFTKNLTNKFSTIHTSLENLKKTILQWANYILLKYQPPINHFSTNHKNVDLQHQKKRFINQKLLYNTVFRVNINRLNKESKFIPYEIYDTLNNWPKKENYGWYYKLYNLKLEWIIKNKALLRQKGIALSDFQNYTASNHEKKYKIINYKRFFMRPQGRKPKLKTTAQL